MAHFLDLLPLIWPWTILICAQVATMMGETRLGLVLLAAFGAVVVLHGLVSPLACAIVLAGLLASSWISRQRGWTSAVGHLGLILWCVALGAHLIPGFENLHVLDQETAGPGSAAFSMYLNLDKPMVFFAVVLAWPAMISGPSRFSPIPLAAGIAPLPGLFLLGWLSGAVAPEIGLPPWWLIFAVSNLFLTCLSEEAFFRGYLQSILSRNWGNAAGLILASLAFGLVHFAGGAALVVFASILGLACGLGYLATGRLWVPVLMHFAFNALHLALFTYPGPA